MNGDRNTSTEGSEPEEDRTLVVSQTGCMPREVMHGSVAVFHHPARLWQQWRAGLGAAILISVSYMTPGKWGAGR